MIQGVGGIAGVDIGSTKTCAVIADTRIGREPDEPLTLLGVGSASAEGINRTAVTNVEAATQAVRTALGQAEAMAGCEVETVYVSIPSAYTKTSRSRGVVAVPGNEVTSAHVKRVQEVGQAVPALPGRVMIDAWCQEYLIDGRNGIEDPVGMAGTRLESDMCIVTADSAASRDFSKIVDRSGYRPEGLVMAPIATAEAVLNDAERETGVALVEVGGASTDVLVYERNRLLHAATLPWGGSVVTRDIARGLGVTEEKAAHLKHRFGTARRDAVDAKEQIDVSGPGHRAGRRVSRELLAHIIEQRLDEIFGLVYEELEEAGVLDRLGAGVVLSGGGVLLPDTDELARAVFNMPVRIGTPSLGIAGVVESVATPAHATAVGLALWGAARSRSGMLVGATRAVARLGGWLREFF